MRTIIHTVHHNCRKFLKRTIIVCSNRQLTHGAFISKNTLQVTRLYLTTCQGDMPYRSRLSEMRGAVKPSNETLLFTYLVISFHCQESESIFILPAQLFVFCVQSSAEFLHAAAVQMITKTTPAGPPTRNKDK